MHEPPSITGRRARPSAALRGAACLALLTACGRVNYARLDAAADGPPSDFGVDAPDDTPVDDATLDADAADAADATPDVAGDVPADRAPDADAGPDADARPDADASADAGSDADGGGVIYTIDLPDFATCPLVTNGNASCAANVLRLTPAAATQRGSAFVPDRFVITTRTSLRASFRFRMHSGSGAGGSGITFLMQDGPPGASSLGQAGGALGYAGGVLATDPPGITPAVAVEFDTARDVTPADPDGNHVAVDTGGRVTAPLAPAVTCPVPLRGAPVFAWIDYDGPTDQLTLYVSATSTRPATPLLTQTVDVTAQIGGAMRVGFTGGTGTDFDAQDLEAFALTVFEP